MKKLLLSTALVLGLAAPAFAQVNAVPQVGVLNAFQRAQTYSQTILGLVPVASATDFFCISGSSSKQIHVRALALSGTAGTLVTTPIVLVHRVSLDTGTAATATYMPAVSKLRSTNGTPSAVVVAYNSTGGNPTIVDSSPTYVRVGSITLPVSGTSATGADRLVWYFGTNVDDFNQGLDIPQGATTEQYCLNLNGVSVSSGVLNGYIEWTEE